MKVTFIQAYVEPGCSFPFSYLLQVMLSQRISPLVEASPHFVKKYGEDFKICFYISAKSKIKENEFFGPSLLRRDKTVEFTVVLPFDVIQQSPAPYPAAMRNILQGVCFVCESLKIDTTQLANQLELIANDLGFDPSIVRSADL